MLAALLLGSAAFAVADDDDKKPDAKTDPATLVADRSATLNGDIKHEGSTTTYRFEYGPTTSYGQSTAAGTIAADNSDQARPVSAVVSGLTPKTIYHFRIRASNDDGTDTGSDQSFTTAAAVATPPGTSPSPGAIPPSTQAPAPRLGGSVLVAPLKGTVKVKRSGASGFATLTAGESVPVGSLVDTRRGTIKLTSSLGGGKTQSGEFRGALFKVGQKSTGKGLTDSSCEAATSPAAPAPRAAACEPRRRSTNASAPSAACSAATRAVASGPTGPTASPRCAAPPG